MNKNKYTNIFQNNSNNNNNYKISAINNNMDKKYLYNSRMFQIILTD